MKNTIFTIVTLALVATSTISWSKSSSTNINEKTNDSLMVSEHHWLNTKFPPTENTIKTNEENLTLKFSIASIIKDYLALKNALVASNDKAAADAGERLLTTFKKVDKKAIPASKHQEYKEIAENAMENAEHISENKGNIGHQREHFASLSKDIKDLIAMFGTPQALYEDYCPMYNGKKGALWISEVKEIKNPYFGSKMLGCGSVKKSY